tara:strand:- start:23136 stop:23441 length:306 start_codon:yes stop_codon:yes gene_type:complete
MEAHEIAEQASSIVSNDRQDQYGDPEKNFELIASYWNTYINNKYNTGDYEIELTSVDVATLMILLKVSRCTTGRFSIDNFRDICGYATLGGSLGTGVIGDA